jgi:general secretion pathway protein M
MSVGKTIGPSPAFTRTLGRSPLIVVVLYVVLAAGFVATVWIAIGTMLDHAGALAQNSELLEKMRGRQTRGATDAALRAHDTMGSPFLDGATVTIAGAVLLQRVVAAVNAVGGTIQSSQVDIETQAKDGLVGLVISCDLQQTALQKLLFDLEAGTPLLLVDQLDVQMAQAITANERTTDRIRVVLGVSGQWQAKK